MNIDWCNHKNVGSPRCNVTPLKLQCIKGEMEFFSEKAVLEHTLDCQCPTCLDWLRWWRENILACDQ